jgi:hypothetical protein
VSPSERSQHPLTSRISRIREIREREFNPSTCEVVSSENTRGKANIASRGFVKGRCQGWMPQLVKLRNNEERRQPLDPGRRRTVGSGTPLHIAHSGVQRLRGPYLDCRSREVPRVEAQEKGHVEIPQGGARVVDRRTRVVWGEEVNTLLTSRISGIRGIRARRLIATTCEVVSCGKCERKVNLR